jgi:ABC-type lipoprotein release transport system permease subunit
MQMIMGTELLLMGFSGTLAGIIMAMPLLIYFYFNPIRFTGEYQKLSESFGYEAILPFSMDAGIFLYQAMMVFLITIILGIYPLNKIHRLRIADAMRN